PSYRADLLRIVAVDLRDARPLTLSVLELLPGRLAAVADLVHIDELGHLQVRLAVPRHDETESRIGDSVHGREADDRLRNVVPEAHRRIVAQRGDAHTQPHTPVASSLLSPACLGESTSLDMARGHRYPDSPDEGRPDYGLAGTDTRQHRRPRSSRRTAPLELHHRCLCQPRPDGGQNVATHPRAPCA